MDLNGNAIEEPKKEDITIRSKNATDEVAPQNKTEYCGSCYGARDGCCNTCEEVREAYRWVQYLFMILMDYMCNIILNDKYRQPKDGKQ